MAKKRNDCLIIMPFGKKPEISPISFDDIYYKIFEPTLNNLNYNCIRADTTLKSFGLLQNILTDLRNLDNLVIADITGGNSNVCYELGIRHAVAPKFTVLVAQENSEIPSDLKDPKHIPYCPNVSDKNIILKTQEKLEKSINDWIRTKQIDSPVFRLLPDYSNIMNELDILKEENENLQEQLSDMESKETYEQLKLLNSFLEERYNDSQNELAALTNKIEKKLKKLVDIEKHLIELKLTILQKKEKFPSQGLKLKG